MLSHFRIANGTLESCELHDAALWFYVKPDDNQKRQLRDEHGINEHMISAALDPDEVSRFDVGRAGLKIIWKSPISYSGSDSFLFDVASVGIFLTGERLVLISSEELRFHEGNTVGDVHCETLFDVVIGILAHTIHHYLGHLKVIKMIARELQGKINTSMENSHLIQMLNLSESLVFYLNAINGNGVVLAKMRSHAEKDGMRRETVALIDELLVENNQCFKQAEIYSTVFSGLMDARGSIVNNNMNSLLKKLTVINVVFLPLNLIAGIGGMSEYSMMTHGIDWRISYPLFTVGMLLLGAFTAWLVRRIDIGNA
jgi:magnesium transporter